MLYTRGLAAPAVMAISGVTEYGFIVAFTPFPPNTPACTAPIITGLHESTEVCSCSAGGHGGAMPILFIVKGSISSLQSSSCFELEWECPFEWLLTVFECSVRATECGEADNWRSRSAEWCI